MTSRRQIVRKVGFTLLELLIVIAIIGVMISILLPSLTNARERGRRVVCENNLRSIWFGVLAYSMGNDDRVPFIEDVNVNDPNADPFSPDHPTAVGTVLGSYVQEKSWRCPSAVEGYPPAAGGGGWKLTYTFHFAGPVGEGIPYDQNPNVNTGGPLDPALANYSQFDGRPIKKLDGRRYIGSESPTANYSSRYDRWWHGRWALVRDSFVQRQNPLYFSPRYPHKGRLQGRIDLGNYRSSYEQQTNSNATTGYNGLFADGETVEMMFTREPMQHPPGY